MKSKKFKIPRDIFCLLYIIFLLSTNFSLVNAEIRDRVVAYVDDTAITLSELGEVYADTLKIVPDITREDVLNTMINRLLLLKEAKKIRLEATSDDRLLREYINLKVRAFINIKEEDIINFYKEHADDFRGKEFENVRDEIENFLIEKDLNRMLESHINGLKKNTCIKMQLEQDFEE
ncbi:MAG: hypothetical protein AB1610_01935 [Nitrospirota bacterium]